MAGIYGFMENRLERRAAEATPAVNKVGHVMRVNGFCIPSLAVFGRNIGFIDF